MFKPTGALTYKWCERCKYSKRRRRCTNNPSCLFELRTETQSCTYGMHKNKTKSWFWLLPLVRVRHSHQHVSRATIPWGAFGRTSWQCPRHNYPGGQERFRLCSCAEICSTWPCWSTAKQPRLRKESAWLSKSSSWGRRTFPSSEKDLFTSLTFIFFKHGDTGCDARMGCWRREQLNASFCLIFTVILYCLVSMKSISIHRHARDLITIYSR